MKKQLIITYIIGTDNVGVDIGANEIDSLEGYRTELQEKLEAQFPEASHVDVVFDNGSSKARVEGIDYEQYELQEQMLEAIEQEANWVWNHGKWHDA